VYFAPYVNFTPVSSYTSKEAGQTIVVVGIVEIVIKLLLSPAIRGPEKVSSMHAS
jgi:hypothetical protein